MAAGWSTNCGIYTITSVSGGFYVGSSSNLTRRWKDHKWRLSLGKHPNRVLQQAWDKYGEQGMVFRKIMLCSPKDLLKWEQHFIDKLQPRYNLSPTASSCLGIKRSDEFKEKCRQRFTGKECPIERREKIRIALTGIPLSAERKIAVRRGMKIQLKTVRCLETGEVFESLGDAGRRYSIDPTAIGRVCNGKRKTAFGFHWEYV